ncbi:MAG: GlsB/YeaQ/YmgE family stress response membrane protein [Chloroflexi bacterium]|nr:MAG: GlsB/YeaQ/YmgE family stress response membrane protein [Chloroflexota bacterium]
MTVATIVLADISLESLIWWLIVGLIAGFLASIVMRGGGYGIVGDIVVGLIGAFIGGWLFSLLGVSSGGGLLGSIIVAFIGACILILLLRAFSRSGPRRRRL